jgi:hypothetical protein
MFKVVPNFSIDWTGFKSVLIHTAWVAGLSACVFLLSLAMGHDWGVYQPLMVVGFSFVGSFLKKYCEQYEVADPN